MKIVGLDIGYGYTKVFSVGGSHTFPTRVSTSIPESVFERQYPIVIVNGKKYLVGERFLSKFGDVETKTDAFIGSDFYLAILGEALIRTYVNPNLLVLGLPPGMYSGERADQLITTVYNSTIIDGNSNTLIASEKIKVIPQGAGIFFDYVLQGHEDALKKNVVVVDIGHYTVDMVFFTNGEYMQGEAMSANIGVSLLFDEVSKELTRKYGLFFKDDEVIARVITSNGINHGGRRFELDCEKFVLSYKEKVFATIDNLLDSAPFDIDLILAAGGGANALRGYKSKYKLLIPANPQMSNAMGYYRYGRKIAYELFDANVSNKEIQIQAVK